MTKVPITIDDIRKGIMRKINTFRDVDTKIYGESIEQNFKEPCFFIKELRSNQNRELGNRYKRSHSYDVHYFPDPDSNSKNQDMREVAELLYDQLEYIEVNSKLIMGQEMDHQIIDGVLHLFVKYPFYVFKEMNSIPTMETLYQEGGIKE